MKLYLLLILSISSLPALQRHVPQHKLPLDNSDLRKEIFIKDLYRDYSFGLLLQIQPNNSITQNAFAALISKGKQRYCQLATYWDEWRHGPLKPFDEYSLSELESITIN